MFRIRMAKVRFFTLFSHDFTPRGKILSRGGFLGVRGRVGGHPPHITQTLRLMLFAQSRCLRVVNNKSAMVNIQEPKMPYIPVLFIHFLKGGVSLILQTRLFLSSPSSK